jgi:hypothetical protein
MINPLLVLKTEQTLCYLHSILAQWKVLGQQQSLGMLHQNEMLDLVRTLLDCWQELQVDHNRTGPNALSKLGLAVRMLQNEERYLCGEAPTTRAEKELHTRFLGGEDMADCESPFVSFRELDEKYWPVKSESCP